MKMNLGYKYTKKINNTILNISFSYLQSHVSIIIILIKYK